MNQLSTELKRNAFRAEKFLRSIPEHERPEMLGQALLETVRAGEDASLVQWLLDYDADVNYKISAATPEMYFRNTEASVLSEAVTFVDSEGLKVLRLLLESGNLKRDAFPEIVMDCVQARVITGAHVISDDPDAQEALRLLLEAGFPVNHQDDAGYTPLHEAVRYFSTHHRFGQASDLVPILLKYGASPLVKNSDGDTPLDLALRTGDAESAELLRLYLDNLSAR